MIISVGTLIFTIAFSTGNAVDNAKSIVLDYSTASMCSDNCNPRLCQESSRCLLGNKRQLDGCRCCFTCPRGQGDLCDFQHPCIYPLTCVYADGTNNPGVCRSNKTCRLASGKVLQDGEIFKPHCSMQCSCQGGLVGCSSLCQNGGNMAFAFDGNCQLVRTPNSCCPQWVCGHSSASALSSLFFRKGMLEPSIFTYPTKSQIPEPSTTTTATTTTTSTTTTTTVSPEVLLREMEVHSPVRNIQLYPSSQPQGGPWNCSGTPIILRSCSVNKCGLRITNDFSIRTPDSCPSNEAPSSTYCMLRPCTKRRLKTSCSTNTKPLSKITVKVRHAHCRSQKVKVSYCRSCRNTNNRCCLPTNHKIMAYNQTCYDGSIRTFYVAQATACSCRGDVFRVRDCQRLYSKFVRATIPPSAQVYSHYQIANFGRLNQN